MNAVEHHVHPERGSEGEELATDVARFGPDNASHVLNVTKFGICAWRQQVCTREPLKMDPWCEHWLVKSELDSGVFPLVVVVTAGAVITIL